MRLNLGAGDTKFDGYISVDKYDKAADVQADITELPYKDNSVESIIAYQVIEHIPYDKTEQMFAEMYRVLKPGGEAYIECPDIEYAAVEIAMSGDIEDKWLRHIWGEYYRPWDTKRYPDALDHAGSKHVTGFTFNRLKRLVEPLGFKIEKNPNKHLDVPENLSVVLTK